MPKIIILDVKGVILRGGENVLRRHENYALALTELDSTSELVIISRHRQKGAFVSRNLNIYRKESLFSFLQFSIKYLKNTEDRALLVCGDPWESFFLARFIQKMTRKHIPIQVQIHADVGSANWRFLNLRNLIKFMILRPAVNGANQLRCVSYEQKKNLENSLRQKLANAVVISVPSFLEADLKVNRSRKNPQILAFVGRIERDRGIERLLKIAIELREGGKNIPIWVIGSGSREKWLKKKVLNAGLASNFSFLGEVSQEELCLLWQKVGCLLSLAPAESFGRAVREALIHGVPVVAVRTSGLIELERDFEENGLFYLGESVSNQATVKLIDRALASKVDEKSIERLILDLDNLSMLLAKSWLSLLAAS